MKNEIEKIVFKKFMKNDEKVLYIFEVVKNMYKTYRNIPESIVIEQANIIYDELVDLEF